MVRKKKNKGVITDGINNYEQLSLFFESVVNDAMGEEPSSTFSIRDEWKIERTVDTFSRGDERSSDENDGRISEGNGELSEQRLSGYSKPQSDDYSESSREDNGVDFSDTTIYSKNYRIIHSDIRLNPKEKFERNIAALECLSDNNLSLEDKQEIISKYTAWGGLPQVFDESNNQWVEERERLKRAVTMVQYQQMKSSVLTSFYTPYEIIEGMYRVLDYVGFQSGKILEPSLGTGNFIGMMPEDMMNESAIYGVELDEISGRIAQNLYPKASIQINGYEKTTFPNHYFDLIISNVPFGRYKVHDIDYNKYNLDIHNYFFMKSLDKVKDGGIVAFVTSTNTLDGNSNIRYLINEKADLLGAIRIPESTFKSNGANTSVVSDIIFLQKKADNDIARSDLSWLNRAYFKDGVYVNQYFIEHPEMVFGQMDIVTNQYGDNVITVRDTGMSFTDRLEEIIDIFPFHIYEKSEAQSLERNQKNLESRHFDYKINEHFVEDGHLYIRKNEYIEKVEQDEDQLKSLVSITNAVKHIIQIQKNDNDELEFQNGLKILNSLYDDYINQYGYINSKKGIKLLKDDPNYYLLTALEKINSDTKEVTKSDFFFKRTIKPIVEIKSVDNLIDAYHLSYNYCGNIDVAYMETIYHKSQEQIEQELIESKLAYLNPQNGRIIASNEYLSGNVRNKLSEAIEAAKTNQVYKTNVEDLQRIQPEWITADNIQVQLGATWVPEIYYEQFVEQLFEFSYWRKGQYNIQYSKHTGQWVMNGWSENYDTNICEKWGVPKVDNLDYFYSQPRYNGFDLFEDIMNSQIPTIRDYWDDDEGKRKSQVNKQRTAIARSLAEKMKLEFSNWIFSDYDRRTHLEEIYNNTLNNYVEREYDGSHFTFPDMNISLKLEKYQKDAVARIIQSKATLLSQRVGAGKTFEMVTACMEMKRMKIANKSMIVVPNHLVDQWKNEFMMAYPQANILAATTRDFEKSRRNEFVHKIATNDFDAIIISHSSFKLIPVSKDIMVEQMRNEIRDIEYGIESLEQSYQYQNSKHIKILERTKKSIESNIQKLTDTHRDDGITFDQLGIDYIFVDEAHEFKNLYIYSKMSNIAGVPQTKSQKASDMYMKTKYILNNGGGVCFATGTPISNTMAELYNMQRYLQEDTLHESGIFCFDAWAKNFGEVVSSLEISIDGSGFQTRQRFSKFFNIPELMTMFRQVATIQTEGMLKKALEESTTGRTNVVPPRYKDGAPKIVAIEPSEELEDYISNVVERTEKIHLGTVDPREDNMLKVTTDSKKASIDLRLIDPDYGNIPGSKIDVVIDNIFKVYNEYDSDKATQIVFCDSSTPSDRFNVYDEIKNGLMTYGVPEEEIAYIHDAKTEKQKTVLFNKVKSGTVRILLGSTAKLGAGTNVQDRLIAVHHIDVPWRASDIEQRNGRAFRQGNMYDEIYEFRYVTKKSFDAYSWQMIETKASYMNQLLEGTTASREIEEDNSSMMSYAEVKAIASGNPLIKEKMEIDNELKKLRMEKNIFNKSKYEAERKLIELPQMIEQCKQRIDKLEADLNTANECIDLYPAETIEEWFKVIINNKEFTNMKEAGEELVEIGKNIHSYKTEVLGYLCGYPFGVCDDHLLIKGEKRDYKLINEIHMVGRVNFIRLLKTIQNIPNLYNEELITLETYRKNERHYHELSTQNFPKEDYLMELTQRQRELNEMLDLSHGTNEVINEETNNDEMCL